MKSIYLLYIFFYYNIYIFFIMEDKKNCDTNKNDKNDDIIMKEEEDSHKKKMEMLDKMMDEITFSDDDEDDQEQNKKEKFVLDQKNYDEEMSKVNKLYEQNIEEGVDEGTMNTYTGTRHEIINEIERKDFPIPYEIKDDDKFEECGYIKNIVENKILMNAINNNISQILNLDNIMYTSDKKCLGFIDDVIGQIDNPIYVIKVYPKLIEEKIFESIHVNDKLYYCSNRANIINAIELKNKNKGCDASNAFDEEVSEGEKDYSDDEEEVNAKIKRKNKKKNKKMKLEENIINNNMNDINNNNMNTQINDGTNNNNNNNNNISNNNTIINAPYSIDNCNKSKEELNKQMDIFVNNAMNMNINPFCNPFNLDNNNNNQIDNNINDNNLNK